MDIYMWFILAQSKDVIISYYTINYQNDFPLLSIKGLPLHDVLLGLSA